MRDVADDADRARTDQKAPEEPDRAVVVPLGDLDLGGHRVPLLAVRSYVTVRSPTSTTILASTPSALRYDASVLISMSPWRSILLICACPTPSLDASSTCVRPVALRIAARSITQLILPLRNTAFKEYADRALASHWFNPSIAHHVLT